MALERSPVLSDEDLNSADREVLDTLQEGRATPSYLSDRLETDRSYLNQRLKRLVEHGHVDRLASGLYELTDDPREDGDGTESGLRARLQDALESRDQAQSQARDLSDDLKECREQLAECKEALVDAREQTVDVATLERALNGIEAAAERGDGDALRDAIQRAREAIGGN